VDDQTIGPLSSPRPGAFASQAAPHPAARPRPTRPIRFTPSRTEPVPAPRVEQSPAAKPESLATRVAVWATIALGWGVFIAWWVIVLRRESARSFGVAIGLLASMLVTSVVATWLWTRHNIRIAKNGKRGRSSLYIPMRWEHDTLGRPLALPPADSVRTASEVRIELQGGAKAYIVATGEEL